MTQLPDAILDKIRNMYQENIKTSILQFQPSNGPTHLFERNKASSDSIEILDVPYRFEYTYKGNHSQIAMLSIRPCSHIQQEFINIIFTEHDCYPYSRPGCYIDEETYICIHKIPKKYNTSHLPFVIAQAIVYYLKMAFPISEDDIETSFKRVLESDMTVELYHVKKKYKSLKIDPLYDELLKNGSILQTLKKNYTFFKSFSNMDKVLKYYQEPR